MLPQASPEANYLWVERVHVVSLPCSALQYHDNARAIAFFVSMLTFTIEVQCLVGRWGNAATD